MRAALEKGRITSKNRLEEAAREREALQKQAREEADVLHAQIENAQNKIAALAGRTWLKTTKASKAAQSKDEELNEARRAVNAIKEEMETLTTMHERTLRLEREKNESLESQTIELTKELNEAIHEKEATEAALLESQATREQQYLM